MFCYLELFTPKKVASMPYLYIGSLSSICPNTYCICPCSRVLSNLDEKDNYEYKGKYYHTKHNSLTL